MNTFIPKSAGFCNQILNTFNFLLKNSNLLNFIFSMMICFNTAFISLHTHTHTIQSLGSANFTNEVFLFHYWEFLICLYMYLFCDYFVTGNSLK